MPSCTRSTSGCPADQLAYVINHAEDRVIIVDASLIPLLAAIKDDLKTVETIIVAGEGDTSPLGETLSYEQLLAAEQPGFEWPDLDEHSAAAMCYTSGTTGNPKGVVYSHRSTWLHTMAEQAASSVGMTETDRILIIVPMFHANAWGTPYGAFMAGTDMIMPQMFLMGEQLANVINEFHPTLACGVPTIWNGLLALDQKIDFSTVRAITAGGAAVPESLIRAFEERFGATIIQGWGMTETSPLAAFGLPPARKQGGHDDMYYKVKAGRIVAGVEMRVVAEDGTILPNDGQSVGEFEIRGPWVTGSYYKDEDPAKFHDGWLRTGDVGMHRRPGLPDHLGPHQGRDQVGRRVDLLGRARERGHGAPRRLRGRRHRRPRPQVVRAPAGRRRPQAGRSLDPADLVAFLPTGCRDGGSPTSGPSSTRCPRRASASSTRRSCAPPTPTATTRCSTPPCPSERAERRHGGHGRAARGDARGAVGHGHRRAQPGHLGRPRLGRDGGGPGHGAPHPQGPPRGRESGLRPAARRRGAPGTHSTRAPTSTSSVRLFVAVWPDEATRQRLGALQLELGRSKGMRFVGPARWHVTLRFLGEVAEADIDPARRGPLDRRGRHAGPLECRLGPGTGWFTGVRVLQLPATGVDNLAAAVRDATVPSCPSRDRPALQRPPDAGPRQGPSPQRGRPGRNGQHPLRGRLPRPRHRPGRLGALAGRPRLLHRGPRPARRLRPPGVTTPAYRAPVIPARLTVVTLAARDLPALRRFYRGLGWPEVAGSDDAWCAFVLGGVVLALYPQGALDNEAGATGSGPGGFTLGLNVDTPDEVDAVHAAALAAGAGALGPADGAGLGWALRVQGRPGRQPVGGRLGPRPRPRRTGRGRGVRD